MSKQLSPAAVVALKEALCAVYWYKGDLRSFLQQCLSNPAVLATLNWGNYKRQIVSDLVDYLTRNQDKHLGDLTKLCYAVCNITSFRHLEQLDGGAQKAERAKEAVAHLKGLVEPHQEVKKEQDDLIERQKLSAEKLEGERRGPAEAGRYQDQIYGACHIAKRARARVRAGKSDV